MLVQTLDQPTRSRTKKRTHAVAGALSVAAHLGVLALVFLPHLTPPPRPPVDEPPVNAILVPAPKPLDAPPLPPSAKSAKAKPPPPEALAVAKPKPAPPEIKPLPAGKVISPVESAELTESEIAGATTAGSGSGGGGGGGGACNMVRRIQEALRKDHLVQAAALAPTTAGKAIRVWNGDWVQSGGEDGKGLAVVREAILWEIGFAPAACKNEVVKGTVLLSLRDGPGSTRLALGGGEWRWADLLNLHGAR